MKRNNGCGTGIKRSCAVAKVRGQAKERCIFLDGEVFFLLTGPLMGDPLAIVPHLRLIGDRGSFFIAKIINYNIYYFWKCSFLK